MTIPLTRLHHTLVCWYVGYRRDPELSSPKCPPEIHAAVLDRDKVCFMYRLDSTHQCRDRFGNPHRPDDRRLLTVDGVKRHPRLGVRADHRYVWFLVAMCGYENNRPPSADTRRLERSYLTKHYPEHWA